MPPLLPKTKLSPKIVYRADCQVVLSERAAAQQMAIDQYSWEEDKEMSNKKTE